MSSVARDLLCLFTVRQTAFLDRHQLVLIGNKEPSKRHCIIVQLQVALADMVFNPIAHPTLRWPAGLMQTSSLIAALRLVCIGGLRDSRRDRDQSQLLPSSAHS